MQGDEQFYWLSVLDSVFDQKLHSDSQEAGHSIDCVIFLARSISRPSHKQWAEAEMQESCKCLSFEQGVVRLMSDGTLALICEGQTRDVAFDGQAQAITR
jgi:hypothetical protein